MPTRRRAKRSPGSDCLLDTSTAIAFVQPDHPGHEETFERLSARSMGLAGHAAFETFSVLTRLPPPQRLAPDAARRLIEHNFPDSRYISAERSSMLLAEFTKLGIAGGSIYDALVGCAAREHELPLVSRDRRAAEVYLSLGVDLELI